jgi:hypothetical protein
LSQLRHDLISLPLKNLQALSASFENVFKTALLPVLVELIGQFDLSHVIGKESAERVSCLTAL